MTRYTFGSSAADFAIQPPSLYGGVVNAAANRNGTAWDSITGGAQLTDLVPVEGATAPSTDANGFINRFQGPDGVDRLWVAFAPAGERFLIIATDAPSGGGGGGGGPATNGVVIVDNGDGTLELQTAAGPTYDVPRSGLQGLPPGTLFTVYKVGTDWHFPGPSGPVITVRPSTRTDLTMQWYSTDGSSPTFKLSVDRAVPATAAEVGAAAESVATGGRAGRFRGIVSTLPSDGVVDDWCILDV